MGEIDLREGLISDGDVGIAFVVFGKGIVVGFGGFDEIAFEDNCLEVVFGETILIVF